MIGKRYGLLASATILTGAACADLTSAPQGNPVSAAALSGAFSSVPVGYGDLASSYVGTGAAGFSDRALWVGGGRAAGFERNALMGGGIQGAFTGDVGFGRGFGHQGPFGGGLPCAGTFDAATGRVSCSPETRNGLTVTRSAAYTDAQGQVQEAFDSLTTNTVNLQTAVSGTVTYTRGADGTTDGVDSAGGRGPGGRHGGPGGSGRENCWGDGRGLAGRLLGDTSTILTASSTVSSQSDRTVSGLAQGSTERTVNGTSAGDESTTGTTSRGNFTATRAVADTTRDVVVPVQANTRTYPTAGTVIRVIEASLTYEGESPVTLSRREVVTYDGSATAQVTITENGVTQNCTRPLPHGPLSCE